MEMAIPSTVLVVRYESIPKDRNLIVRYFDQTLKLVAPESFSLSAHEKIECDRLITCCKSGTLLL